MTTFNISALKKSSSDFSKLNKEIEKINTPTNNNNEDNRFWKPEVDKAGNGFAVIRFLPAPAVDGEDALPWVRIWNHGFKGPGGWYIENSLTTLGQKDPVGEYNISLWNSGIEANKRIVQGTPDRPGTKRRLNYISNILVIQDPKNPQNEGKVFLYKYGKKIFDKLSEAMNPPVDESGKLLDPDVKPMNPFDFWKGADFKLKIRKVEGFQNYDKSEFNKSTELFDGDEEQLKEIWEKEYSLAEQIAPKLFKSYNELKSRMERVLGLDASSSNNHEENTDRLEENLRRKATSVKVATTDQTPNNKKQTNKKVESLEGEKDTTISDDDKDLDYFRKIAEEV